MRRRPKFTVWHREPRTGAEQALSSTVLQHHPADIIPLNPRGAWYPSVCPRVRDVLRFGCPDILVTSGMPELPVVAVVTSRGSCSGHEVFRRLPALAACAEQGFPVACHLNAAGDGDEQPRRAANPLIMRAVLQMGRAHHVPTLLFASGAQGEVAEQVWQFVDLAVQHYLANEPFSKMVYTEFYAEHEARMWEWFHARGGSAREWSPLTSCSLIAGLNELRRWARDASGVWMPRIPDHLREREESLVYRAGTRDFRSDPYAGALIALDYLRCRNGPTRQHRFRNLVLHLPEVSISEMVEKAQRFYQRDCPLCWEPEDANLSRLYSLHLREGCRYTKQKEIRTFCAFADMIVFRDGIVI